MVGRPSPSMRAGLPSTSFIVPEPSSRRPMNFSRSAVISAELNSADCTVRHLMRAADAASVRSKAGTRMLATRAGSLTSIRKMRGQNGSTWLEADASTKDSIGAQVADFLAYAVYRMEMLEHGPAP